MDFNYHAREIYLGYCRAGSGKRFADDVIDLIISTFFFLVFTSVSEFFCLEFLDESMIL
jgi:hypothetical protein